MNIKKLLLLFTLIGTALLLGGCEKQKTGMEPETVMDSLVSPEELSETGAVTESATAIPGQDSAADSVTAIPGQDSTSNSAAATIPGQNSTAIPEQDSTSNLTSTATPEQDSAPAPKPQNSASETPKTTKTASEAPKNENASPTAPKTDSATPDKFITVSKDFTISDTWISTISFQMPENWNYRADEDPSDWGFWINIPDHEDFTLYIHALPGTFNVEGFYTTTPTDFVTDSGMKGKLYMEKSAGSDGLSHIEGNIVFGQPSSGINLSADEGTYNQYKDTLQKIFLSITIKDTYTE